MLLAVGSRLRTSQSILLQRLLQFNYALANDVHESCLDAWNGPKELVSRIRCQPRGAVRLTQMLNAAMGYTPLLPSNFTDTSWQVALLPGSVLMRLIQLSAAALLCEPICSELGRQRRIELEQALPPDVLLFARHRCRLTAGPIASQAVATLLPRLADGVQNWSSRIEETCRIVCGSLWEAYPAVVRARVALKLPRQWHGSPDQRRQAMGEPDQSAWRLALRLLETELLTDWNRCFN